MDLYNYIWKRKSTRKYVATPLDTIQLNQITQFANNLKPLYPGIQTSFDLTTDVRNIMPVKAPHYFIISSKNSEGYLENIGFMFQQMDLFLSSLELGSCWLGMAKPTTEPKTELPFVIIQAFGTAKESPHRPLSAFRRKSISDISTGLDERLEAARVAPSASNSQNWFFIANGGKIDTYQKKTLTGLYEKMNKIDMGIALCHLYIASEHLGREFIFSKDEGKEKKGYYYIGTVN